MSRGLKRLNPGGSDEDAPLYSSNQFLVLECPTHWSLCSHRWDRKANVPQPWVGSTFMDGHWLWPLPPPRAPSLINDLVFLIYEQPLQTRVGASYSPARPAQLE